MAAREGNPVKLKLCLDNGADLEYKDVGKLEKFNMFFRQICFRSTVENYQ